MCGNNGCWWIIILILIISCQGNCGCGCGNNNGCGCGCNRYAKKESDLLSSTYHTNPSLPGYACRAAGGNPFGEGLSPKPPS